MKSIKMVVVMNNGILWKNKCPGLNQNKEMIVCYMYIQLIKVKIIQNEKWHSKYNKPKMARFFNSSF